jgi:hypothetical protein
MAVQNSSRKWMFIGGGVVAAVALVIGFQNYPPQPKDSTGTIGAAQRYHEPQITGADVKVSQDELTTWLQSDTFDRIVKDPEARRLFANEAVQRVLAADARNQIALAGDSRNRNQVNLAGDANNRLSVADDARNQVKLAGDANNRLSVADDLRKQLSPSDFAMVQAALSNDLIRLAMSSDMFCRAMANDGLRKELVNEARKADGVGKVD